MSCSYTACSSQLNSSVSFLAQNISTSYSPFSTSLPIAQLFPPTFPLPPNHPNTAPHCNKLVQHVSSPHVVSPLIHNAWAHFLANYPDKEFVSSYFQVWCKYWVSRVSSHTIFKKSQISFSVTRLHSNIH